MGRLQTPPIIEPVERARDKQHGATAEALPDEQDCVWRERGKKEAVQLVWERKAWRCASRRQRRGAKPLCPVSQNVPALPGIPGDRGCQELPGCPGQMPSTLLATEPFLQTKPNTEMSDPAPGPPLLPLREPPIHFNSPIYSWNKGKQSRWEITPHLPTACPALSPSPPGFSCGRLGTGGSVNMS